MASTPVSIFAMTWPTVTVSSSLICVHSKTLSNAVPLYASPLNTQLVSLLRIASKFPSCVQVGAQCASGQIRPSLVFATAAAEATHKDVGDDSGLGRPDVDGHFVGLDLRDELVLDHRVACSLGDGAGGYGPCTAIKRPPFTYSPFTPGRVHVQGDATCLESPLILRRNSCMLPLPPLVVRLTDACTRYKMPWRWWECSDALTGEGRDLPSVMESPMDGTTAWMLSHSRLPVRKPRNLVGAGLGPASVLG